MKKKKASIIILSLSLFLLFNSGTANAWGPKGHTIVGQIAMNFLKEDVRRNVQAYLGSMTIAQAANWMDSMRSNSDYDFMKPWHYLDFPKEGAYINTNDENIVNRLLLTYNELKHKKTLGSDQIKTDLLILFHLMGDLHQPLHNGYDIDLGGNKLAIQYDTTKTNLHHFWDENIIDIENISLESCLKLYDINNPGMLDSIKGVQFVSWMKESRLLLPLVYDYEGYEPGKKYMLQSKAIIERQLLVAGMRLAAVLEKLFYTPSPVINTAALNATYKNGVEASDAINHVGQHVTVCSRIFGIKKTNKVCLINLGAKYPNSPLTIVIMAKDFDKFNDNLEEMYNDKNVCMKGTVGLRNGRAEMVVDSSEDIEIQ